MTREQAVELMKTVYSLARLVGSGAEDVALRDYAYVIRDLAYGAVVGFEPDFFTYKDLMGLIEETR